MKFLCDRCKTRYSIGDDRVRGKILKIRCKNCANVITVREGMTDQDTSEAVPGRSHRPTTMAPATSHTASAASANGGPSNALGAAFVSAMTKPPPALEEEWYVSDDGEQEGPFSLAEAQRWVAAKVFDADLHCWSEGFDDWLPVDKVSHFRGLRKKPPPAAAPPPLPRVGSGPSRALSHQVEEDPKPLFAATMASLERSAPAVSTPAMPLIGNTRPSATPPTGQPAFPIQAKTNGSAVKVPSIPSVTPAPNRSTTSPGPGVGRAASADLDAATVLQSAPFQEEPTVGEPIASAKRLDHRQADKGGNNHHHLDAAATTPRMPVASSATTPRMPLAATTPRMPIAAKAANAPMSADLDDDGDDDSLSIGEVSRVVNLADIVRNSPRSKERAGPVATRRSGPIANGPLAGRGTASNPNLSASAPISAFGISNPAALDAHGLPLDANRMGETSHDMAAAAPATSHRRGMIMLLSVAGVMLLGVVGAVLLFVVNATDDTSLGLRGGGTIDTTRPDDVLKTGNGDQETGKPVNPFMPPKLKPPVKVKTPVIVRDPIETNPGMVALRPDEVEAEAGKRSTGTQRCYMRSQKGADAILIGDVKKIAVTLTVDKDGNVTNVSLSDHATDSLGKCLSSSIRGWKFRQSQAGITAKITMVFQSG